MQVKHLGGGHETGNRTKKHINRVRALLWTVLVIAGLFLLFVGNFNHIQGFLSQGLQSQVTGTAQHNKQKTKPSYNFGSVKPVSPKTLAEAYARRSNYKAVGQVAVPSLNINLNIYRGVGNIELNLGAGTMKPGEKMGKGNYCLAGHNMDDGRSYFSPLYSTYANPHMRIEDRRVYIMNYYRIYAYKIDKAYFIAATRTDLLASRKNKRQISLFTCDYTGAGRLFVQGHYLYQKPLNKASKVLLKDFKK